MLLGKATGREWMEYIYLRGAGRFGVGVTSKTYHPYTYEVGVKDDDVFYFISHEEFEQYLTKLGYEVLKWYFVVKKSTYYTCQLRAIEEILFLPVGSTELIMSDPSPSQIREIAERKGLAVMNDFKKQEISKLSADTIHDYFLVRLKEEQRALYQSYIVQIHKLIDTQQLRAMPDLDISRIAVLKVCEAMGLAEFLTGDKDNPTLQGYVNIARMLGNEGQRVMEENINTQGKGSNLVDELKQLKDAGVEVTFKGRPETIDVKEKANKVEE